MKSTNDKNGNRWTTEKLQELIGMWLRGVESEEMAQHFGITIIGLQKLALRLRKNGIPLPQRRKGHKAERRNKPWTQEEVETVVRMRNERASTAEIATTINRTFYGVQNMILNLRNVEDVPVVSLGTGRRRLWDAQRLRDAIAGRNLMPHMGQVLPMRKKAA